MPEFEKKPLRHKAKTKIVKTPKPKKHYSKSFISEDHIDQNIMEEVEQKVTFLELFTRSLIASAITAVGIATAFFPPTAPFAIFIIPAALTLSAAIVKTTAEHYIKQNPNGLVAKFFGALTGARGKGKEISKKLFRDKNALEGVLIETVASASKNKGVKKTAEGISASRVMSGEGSKQEQAAFKKQQQKFNKDVASSIQTNLVSNKNKEKIVSLASKQAAQQIKAQNKNKHPLPPTKQPANLSTTKKSVKPLDKAPSTAQSTSDSVKIVKSSKLSKEKLKLIKQVLQSKKTGLKDVSNNQQGEINRSPTPSVERTKSSGRYIKP